MKLNLGCNTRIKEGYLNVDRDFYPGVNYQCDVSDLSSFKDESIEEIYASHILEHFSHTRTADVLKEWRRVLQTGGILKLAVPDFRRAIDIYLKCGMKDWIVYFLYGDQGYEGANHYCAFDEGRLKCILESIGFCDISRVDSLPGSDSSECSNNISNMDNKSVSLNIVAVK